MSDDKNPILKHPVTLAVVVAAIGLGVLGWLLTPEPEEPVEPPPVVQAAPIVPAVQEPIEEPEPPVTDVPPAPPVVVEEPLITEETADEEARSIVDTLNGGRPAAQFVAGDYIVERSVSIADHLRQGEVPYTLIPVNRPKQPFKVLDDGLRVTIHPDSFQRYDSFAQWIDGVDAEALVVSFRKFSGVASAALVAMGITDISIDEIAVAAVTEIISVPNVDLSAELMKKEANWVYVDPELEAMPALHKQLVRMGPINMELVQSKAREIRGALLDGN